MESSYSAYDFIASRARLDEILGDARAHRAEANETDIHAASLEAEEGVIL